MSESEANLWRLGIARNLGVATLQASASDLGVAAYAATVKIKITKNKKKKKTKHSPRLKKRRRWGF